MRTKECIKCNKLIKGSYETKLQWSKRKYCSNNCRRGTKRSEEEKRRISETCKKNCMGWKIGRPRPLELRKLQSIKMRERVAKGLHNFWKGGISKTNRSFKSNFQNTVEYRLWRTEVFKRDNYQCIWCGVKNGNGKRIILNADHIKPFAIYPELRLEIENGRTLCRECHYKRHTKLK